MQGGVDFVAVRTPAIQTSEKDKPPAPHPKSMLLALPFFCTPVVGAKTILLLISTLSCSTISFVSSKCILIYSRSPLTCEK